MAGVRVAVNRPIAATSVCCKPRPLWAWSLTFLPGNKIGAASPSFQARKRGLFGMVFGFHGAAETLHDAPGDRIEAQVAGEQAGGRAGRAGPIDAVLVAEAGPLVEELGELERGVEVGAELGGDGPGIAGGVL